MIRETERREVVDKGRRRSCGHQIAVRVRGGRRAREMVKDSREEGQTEEAREERWTEVPGEKRGRDVKDGQRQSEAKAESQGWTRARELVKDGESAAQQTQVPKVVRE